MFTWLQSNGHNMNKRKAEIKFSFNKEKKKSKICCLYICATLGGCLVHLYCRASPACKILHRNTSSAKQMHP
jgi:hypothetical protein